MKKSMIVMTMMVMTLSLNLFGVVENHVCTTECNHEEVKKECGDDCSKPCCADKNLTENHACTEKCDIAKNHVCTDDCKSDDSTEICELAALKINCSDTVSEQGCNPTGCGQKAVKKGCLNK